MTPEAARLALGQLLKSGGYTFVTPTPATHARVVARASKREACTPRDVFGWSLPFQREALAPELVELLRLGGALEQGADGRMRSSIRFSTLGNGLFLHSAFPTEAPDSVFFGPDTYRFVRFVRSNAPQRVRLAVDVGAGSGAGGLSLADRAEQILLTDINARALEACRINAALNGRSAVEVLESDLLHAVPGRPDLILMNPPYLVDDRKRSYRDGGGKLGLDLALRFVPEGLRRLAPGGTLLLYTGTPIVEGKDPLKSALESLGGFRSLTYEELDPDVFGEELDRLPYADVDRLAVVGVSIRM